MMPESLSRVLQEFLGGSRHAVVLEDGARLFNLADSKYSPSTGFGGEGLRGLMRCELLLPRTQQPAQHHQLS